MSLADRTPTNQSRGTPCSVGILLDTIPADDRKVLEGWLERDSGHSSKAIHRELRSEYNHQHDDKCNGDCPPDLVPWGETPIDRHRRGDCKCDQ